MCLISFRLLHGGDNEAACVADGSVGRPGTGPTGLAPRHLAKEAGLLPAGGNGPGREDRIAYSLGRAENLGAIVSK